MIPPKFLPSNPSIINKLKKVSVIGYVEVLVVFTDSNSQLPNHLFEELAMDVYDEIDRREIEASK